MKAKKRLSKHPRKPQAKLDPYGYRRFDDRKIPAYIQRNKNQTLSVLINYQSSLRMIGGLGRSALEGVTAADKALNDLAKAIQEVRRDPWQPGMCLFNNNEEWHTFLINKLMQWVLTPTPEELQFWFNIPNEDRKRPE